jgi:hypothetical protein
MSRAKPTSRSCDTCQRAIAVGDHVTYGSIESGYRELCSRCFNEEIARTNAIAFQHVQFDPIEMPDAAGERHEFHFRVHLFGDRVSMESFELCAGEPGGYQFQALADAEADLFELLAQLIERMRRALSVRHLKEERQFGLSIADFLVRGRIDWDPAEHRRVPLLVIDGREVTWEEFGRMLMSFEGWQFKLEIRDRSDEI